jgi:uracil-DNA glycosylase
MARAPGRVTRRASGPLAPAVLRIPAHLGLAALRRLAAGCTACDLYRRATQTVFGRGPATARVVFVGEQPGHEEDLAGEPFVGPAGRLLDRALVAAGIDRSDVYVTNIVKHFKWEPRGKRRIHAKPNGREVAACLPWLGAEIARISPEVIVCLGATAAQGLFGRDFRVREQRGRFVSSSLAPRVMATVHPSAVLRSPDEATRREEMQRFVQDLQRVASVLRRRPRHARRHSLRS